MPHAVFNLGQQNATVDTGGRSLIPGIEPGGSRAGQATKPALLIKDAYIEIVDFVDAGASLDYHNLSVYLKLSQETDLTPGLLLLLATIGHEPKEASAVARFSVNQLVMQYGDKIAGTIWAPRMVGVRFVEIGDIQWDIDVHLDYERVDVPWMDWFIMWEFLDGVVDNERQY